MRKLRFIPLLTLFAFVLFMPTATTATTLAYSSLATTDGWTISDLFLNTALPGGLSQEPSFIRNVEGGSAGWDAFHAPGKFTAPTTSYGGSLQFRLAVQAVDPPNDYPFVVIGSSVDLSFGGRLLQFRFANDDPPGDSTFHFYSIPLSAGQWTWASPDGDVNGEHHPGTLASAADLETALQNLAFINFNADWFTGSDQTDLKRVQLCDAGGCDPVPEPTSLFLMGTGLALGLMALARRRASAR